MYKENVNPSTGIIFMLKIKNVLFYLINGKLFATDSVADLKMLLM